MPTFARIADEFAADGYIVAAPDLFWRTVPGPLPRERRAAPGSAHSRGWSASRPAKPTSRIRWPTCARLPQFNGKAAVMGFCYGGPYAIIAPKRLGYAAGVSCHGTQLLDYIGELDGVNAPVCIIWGDKDHAAPPPVQEAYRVAAPRFPNLDLHIFPGVLHGYMMPDGGEAFDKKTRDFSMARAKAILNELRGARATLRQAS